MTEEVGGCAIARGDGLSAVPVRPFLPVLRSYLLLLPRAWIENDPA